jgi:hypothetical protein
MTNAELKALRILSPHFCLTMPRLIDHGVKSTTIRRLAAAGFVEVTSENLCQSTGSSRGSRSRTPANARSPGIDKAGFRPF